MCVRMTKEACTKFVLLDMAIVKDLLSAKIAGKQIMLQKIRIGRLESKYGRHARMHIVVPCESGCC